MSKERLEEIKDKYKEDVYDCKLGRFDIGWLIEQAELVQELERQRKEDLHDFVNRLIRENKRYREALKFYADKSIYNFETETDFDEEETRVINKGRIFRDFGNKAREALEESK